MTKRSEGKEEVRAVHKQLNDAWLDGRPADLDPLLHDDIAMVFPGFSGRITGKKPMIDGFVDFCQNAVVHSFKIEDEQIDVAGDAAVASMKFEMVYERDGAKYLSTGRDVWVLSREGGSWKAVWRTMLDVMEEPVEK